MTVLPAIEETMLHGMIDKQTEIGRSFGMDINVKKLR